MGVTLAGRRKVAGALVGVLLLGFGIVWFTQYRPDPGAGSGARRATVSLLTADARLGKPISNDAADLARRAALLRQTWDPSVIRTRAAALPAPGPSAAVPVVTFRAQEWGEISATPRRASLVVRGGYVQNDTEELGSITTWRVELARMDPVGANRGWRLVSVTPSQ